MSVDLELAQSAAKYKNKQKIKDRFISGFIGIFAIVWIFPIKRGGFQIVSKYVL